MFELIIGIMCPIAVFIAGYIYRDILLFRDLMDQAKHIDKLLTEEIKKKLPNSESIIVRDIRKLKHEMINGIHYFFLEKDDAFACQGKTLTEAAANYALTNGNDILGVFNHLELKKNYCFVESQCLEFTDEQH
jgi:hypothetical protein